jgi:NhaP-type Na+/H+ or K+/H+ antiporter
MGTPRRLRYWPPRATPVRHQPTTIAVGRDSPARVRAYPDAGIARRQGDLMTGLTVLAVVFVAYALVAARLDRWWITAPMVFVAAGLVLGPRALGILPFSLSSATVLTITELTLALILFSDGSTVRLRDVEGGSELPERLLFAGLPLTVAAGTLAAHFLFHGVQWALAALIATILAPTDSALGLAVVTNKVVPVRIRKALNVESGLNDGLVTPFVTLFIAVTAAEEHISGRAWAVQALKEIGLAVAAAAVAGIVGGKLLGLAKDRGWTSQVSEQIATLALALLAYEGSVTIGGNGFVAAFAAGILFRAATTGRQLAAAGTFTETLGLTVSFLVWAIFGALFAGRTLTHGFSARPILYAALSLTVIRMVPVAVALTRAHLRPATIAFVGWFGPRGLASVVFTLIALQEFEHSGDGQLLVDAATWTILLSVVLHGISASPLAARYGTLMAKTADAPEMAPAGEPAIRLHHLAGRDPTRQQPGKGEQV